MKVPEEIRKVKRPVNTIVEDSGRDGPKRYSVRERSAVKYVPGKILSRIMGKLSDISSILSLFQLKTKLRQRQNLRCYPTVL